MSGKPTGVVLENRPGKPAFEALRGTELPANNGIDASPDGREIYVVSSGLRTIVSFRRGNPATRLGSTRPLPFTPDNVHVGSDGKLYTAGMAADVPECGGRPGPQHDLQKLAACPRGSVAAAIDPRTMRDAIVLETPALRAFSNATMVLPVGKEGWFGTFSGDRIAVAPMRQR
jgi:sugar lactone lactonase YvrE